MTQREKSLVKILKNHKKWANGEAGGSRANFCGEDLRDINFSGVDLKRAKFQAADLMGANFSDASLRGANFCYADLCNAVLNGADLQGANIDYSCWPLWNGSLDVKVDKGIFCQLAYHLCRVIVDDDECKEAQLMLGKLANEFHYADEWGRVATKGDKK